MLARVRVSNKTIELLRIKREITGLKNEELVEFALVSLRNVPVKIKK